MSTQPINPVVSQPPRVVGVSALTSHSTNNTTTGAVTVETLSSGDPIDMYFSDGTRFSNAIAFGMLMEKMKSMATREDCFSYYLSILSLVFPGLTQQCKQILLAEGYRVSDLGLPAHARELGLSVPPAPSSSIIYLALGQLLLLPFKNISSNSYSNFMFRRAMALAAILGIVESDVSIVLGIDQAKLIRTQFGNVHSFKKTILNTILQVAARDDTERLSRVCTYVANILKYAEMTGVRFINDTLTCPISPVLRDPRVFSDVKNFLAAMKAVVQTPPVEYFGILGNPSEFNLLERNKFPTLFAVAARLKMKTQPSAANFVMSSAANGDLVNELVHLHESTVSTEFPILYQQALDFLCT